MKYMIDRPQANTAENHEARLATMNLKYGATAVYRDSMGTYWATIPKNYSRGWGYTLADVDHNITQMVKIMQAEKLTYMGKAYDSDVYKSKARITEADLEAAMCYDYLVTVNPQLPIKVQKMHITPETKLQSHTV